MTLTKEQSGMLWSKASMIASDHCASVHKTAGGELKDILAGVTVRSCKRVMDHCPVDALLAFDGVMIGLVAAFSENCKRSGMPADESIAFFQSMCDAYTQIYALDANDTKIDMEVAGHA